MACTSLPQEWHKPRGKEVRAEPVMKMVFWKSETDRVGRRKGEPVKLRLHQACRVPINDPSHVRAFGEELRARNDKCPMAWMTKDTNYHSCIKTVVGLQPLGSAGWYHTHDFGATCLKKFIFTNNINCLEFGERPAPERYMYDWPFHPNGNSYPDVPMGFDDTAAYHTVFPNVMTQNFVETNLRVDIDGAKHLERSTTGQRESSLWFQARKFRLTASNFGRVIAKINAVEAAVQRGRVLEVTQNFITDVMNVNSTSSSQSSRPLPPALAHGITTEAEARRLYLEGMKKHRGDNVIVYDSGLVVDPRFPFLGATPDGKVLESGCTLPFGLIEIKCPYSGASKSFDEKCAERDFYMKKDQNAEDEYRLVKTRGRGKHYYQQVQGQLAITGMPWCDFIVFLSGSREMAVERIYFNKDYWDNTMIGPLSKFYFDYSMDYLLSLSHASELLALS